MAAMSDYLENAVVNLIFNNASLTPPSTYIALLTTGAADSDTGSTISVGGGTGVEVSTTDTAYARLLTTDWLTSSDGQTSNNSILVFPTASADWGTIVGMAICDAATDGNILFYADIEPSQAVVTGNIVEFDANSITVAID